MEEKLSKKAIFDALTGSSMDGCDPDWCHAVLDRAAPGDVAWVREVVSRFPENEVETLIRRRGRSR